MIALDVRLTVRRSDALEDWWVIERAEHDGRVWSEEIRPHVFSICCSSRINSADIEGTGSEMLRIAEAIEEHGAHSERRCAAVWTERGVDLWSPRNSMMPTLVTHERATELAAVIRREVSP